MRVEPVQPQSRAGDGFGWAGFLAWATAGAALGLTWLSALSIGIFLLLPALILLVVVARRFGGGWQPGRDRRRRRHPPPGHRRDACR